MTLRYTFRTLFQAPGFAVVVVLSLGLGIGATATAFTWIDSFLLRPFAVVRESDRLVGIHTQGPGGAEWNLSYPKYQQWRDAVQAFNGMVVHTIAPLSLRLEAETAERVWGQLVSGNYFDVLGVRAVRGRTFLPDEERQAAQVVVLSQSYWRRKFM